MAENLLYFGDNLEVMREHMPDASVDLIYLDPPFNSARNYNVLFKQAARDENQAQIVAFEDTWQWSKLRYDEFFEDVSHARLFDLMNALHRILGGCDMMAYLVMMAPRLFQMHRVLKPTGSLYLHCDPTASHYLKLLMDVIFEPGRFRNEITWKRQSAHNDAKQGRRAFGNIADILLFYTKSDNYTFNTLYTEYSDDYIKSFYKFSDADGRRYRLSDMTGPGGAAKGNPKFEVMGVTRYWRYSRSRMDDLIAQGRVVQTKPGTVPQEKRYLDEMPGVALQNIWDDIVPAIRGESLGYPTQKPLALLERIINASSNPGDIVFDPFCGCGTAVVAAEKLGRRWVGIDITYVAVNLMISRLTRDFGLQRGTDYQVVNYPRDSYAARKLFEESPKQFEIWAVSLIDGGVPQPGKVGDRGLDGKVYFQDLDGKPQYAVVQVKGGKLNTGMIRDFAHVIEREKAVLGFFISLETPTRGMINEAEELGVYTAPSGRKIPRLQLRTVKELMDEGKPFDIPQGYSTRISATGRAGKALAGARDQVVIPY